MDNSLEVRLGSLDVRLRRLHEKASAVDAVIAERRTRASKLGKEVAEAKHRLGMKPDVEQFMLALQNRVHQRGVGLYEKLLTALVQDVLPENPYPVTLDLSTVGGLPALTIQLGRDETAQDIYHDTGGSLTNVVSSGLRFVALARSPLRKFLVLDEPDCWIESFRIPRFADILASMATEVGVQAILISHHADTSFVSIPDRMRLEKEHDKIIVRASQIPKWDADAQPGIRSIRLERFMSHRDTTIHLGPGINVLSGPNHIGKSAIVNALRVFAYHEGADRQIMHGCDDFVITITLEHNRVLTIKRVRKGKRKTVYSFFEPGMDAPREEPADKKDIPQCIMDALNIQKLNDLDIQLSHQKMPVFMLNEPKTKQATLLSAGMEADHVRQMLERYRKWGDVDRSTIRTGEKELTELSSSLNAWDAMFAGGGVSDAGRHLDSVRADLHDRIGKAKYLNDLTVRWSRLEKMRLASIVPKVLVSPKLQPVDPMYKCIARWSHAEKVKTISFKATLPASPVLIPVDPIAKKGRSWQKAVTRATMLKKVAAGFPAGNSHVFSTALSLKSASLVGSLKKWEDVDNTLLIVKKELQAVTHELSVAENEKQEILKAAGGICPLCTQSWPHKHKIAVESQKEAA